MNEPERSVSQVRCCVLISPPNSSINKSFVHSGLDSIRPIGSAFFPLIDDAIRGNGKIRIGGKQIDLTTEVYQKAIEKAVEDPVRQFLEGLRGMDDRIDLIAVMGGEPRDVANAIKRERPNLPVYWAPENAGKESSMFSNLMGFQGYAEALDARFMKEAQAVAA